MYGRLFHFRFDWNPKTGESCDRVNYGPIDTTASSWIVPASIEEEEPEEGDGERAISLPAPCPECGQKLIRGLGASVCENWLCDSLPKITASAATLEAWEGL